MHNSLDYNVGQRLDADHDAAGREFNLVRYFSLACIGVFVVVTSLMCTGFYYISKRYIRIDAEHHAIPIAERLAPLAFVDRESIPSPQTPEYELLDRQMRDVLRPLRIFKIKIYDANGMITYSTDTRIQVGRLDPQNELLGRALAGEIVSDLQTGKEVWDLDQEEKIEGVVVETYIPVPGRAPNAASRGVFEIYLDVTATYARLPGVIGLIVGASVLAMGILYGILFLIVRKASDIIREQTRTIHQAKADLEKYALQLEQRVEERTRELRETLAQQRHDEKMVAMGTLAAGVAHELNTPLGSILGSTQLVLEHCMSNVGDAPKKRRTGDGITACGQCVDDLSRVESQARRCREIIRNLVGFSRKSDGERTWEVLGELVERSAALVGPQAGTHGVQINVSIDDELPPLLVNGSDIQQVLVNIMNNGIAAMERGGVLHVRVTREEKAARIEIRDTGIGIEENNLSRIFEPFFTTKDVGQGTGLGLSISYRIVTDHGGSISTSSIVGEGSKFVVELPVDSQEMKSPRQGEAASVEPNPNADGVW
jgi:signal transduction histidine kinase